MSPPAGLLLDPNSLQHKRVQNQTRSVIEREPPGGLMKALDLAKVALLALALSTSACAQTYMIKGMQGAPDADAKITAKVVTENNLTQIAIKAEHLAPPERLLAGSKSYVVWARQGDGEWVRIAKLNYDPGARKGDVEAASVPFTGFELAISAENQDAPKTPSTTIIFSQKISN